MAPPTAAAMSPLAGGGRGGVSSGVGPGSAAGTLALLHETNPALLDACLARLEPLVAQYWHEIASSLPRLEELAAPAAAAAAAASSSAAAADDALERAQRAALIASRVCFHLERWPAALRWALAAGSAFTSIVGATPAQLSGSASSARANVEFTETLLAKFVDEYAAQKQAASAPASAVSAAGGSAAAAAAATTGDDKQVDPRLEAIVDSMFERTFRDGRFKESIGIAIECRRMDHIKHALRSGDTVPLLGYAQRCALDLLLDRSFRQSMLRAIVEIYKEQEGEGGTPANALRVCECLTLLDDPAGVADVLVALLKRSGGDRNHDDTLSAFQVAFDLAESATQQFRHRVQKRVEENASGNSAVTTLVEILRGDATVRLHLAFLARHNKADLLVLNQLKAAVEQPKSAVLHSSVVVANALMHSGTTSDKFLRDNLEWLSRASNWAKFTAVAGLGVIHKGRLVKAQQLLAPYLPGASGGAGASAYQEGGALYAMGLIHANHGHTQGSTEDGGASGGEAITEFLLTQLAAAAGNDIVQHGACLGLGLVAMATQDERVFAALRNVLMSDSAVAGEAAGLAMGLVLCGADLSAEAEASAREAVEAAQAAGDDEASTPGEKIAEMLGFARDTEHEKIIRGLSVGVALATYGQESDADGIIEQMLAEQDPIIRYGGVWAIALAYTGAGSHSGVLQRLLHVAVSAVTDDERRAATTALGFVLHREARTGAARAASAAAAERRTAAATAAAGLAAAAGSSPAAPADDAAATAAAAAGAAAPAAPAAAAAAAAAPTPAAAGAAAAAAAAAKETGDAGSVTGDSSLLPSLARTLSASFNPHVRYGAAMALGVGFAGTGDVDALALLRPLAETDRVDFVRQGALIAGSMICIQANDPPAAAPVGAEAPESAGAAAAMIAALGGPPRLASELLQEQVQKGLPMGEPKKTATTKKTAAGDKKKGGDKTSGGDVEMADTATDAKKKEGDGDDQKKKDGDDKKDGEHKTMSQKMKEAAALKAKRAAALKPKTPQEEEEAALKKVKAAQPPIASFRQLLHDKAHDRREELLCKYGAVISHGIVDAGGRNVTLSLSPITAGAGAAANSRAAVCGMAIFLQHWFFHSYAHCLSLAMQPTAVIAVDGELRIPAAFEMSCAAPERVFAYPPARVAEKKTKAKKVKKAVLSTTRRQQRRAAEKGTDAAHPETGVDNTGPNDAEMADAAKGAAADAVATAADAAAAVAASAEATHSLPNPTRATLNQVPLLRFAGDDEGARWQPIHGIFAGEGGAGAAGADSDVVMTDDDGQILTPTPDDALANANTIAGIVVLRDTKPDSTDKVEYVDTDGTRAANAAAEAAQKAEEGDEPEPPAPFVFDPTLE